MAAAIADVMNLAGLVRRGDDAAWVSIGDDAPLRVAGQLRDFADLAEYASLDGLSMSPGVELAVAAVHARALAAEVSGRGIPVSAHAQALATELLGALGIGEEILAALDGE